MPSQVPKPDARRQRHEVGAAASARKLPVAGRVGPAPACPVELGAAGKRWWRWAWSTPQATTWNSSYLETLARRASLEDAYEAAKDQDDPTLARGRLLPTMVRLDEAFGFNPAAAAKQHLVFVDDEPEPLKSVPDAKVAPIRGRLKGVRE